MNHHDRSEKFLQFLEQYQAEGEVPQDLKEDVFNTIDKIELISEMLDLFTTQFLKTESSIFEHMDWLNDPDLAGDDTTDERSE